MVALPAACLISTGVEVAIPLISNRVALLSRGLAMVITALMFSTYSGGLPTEKMQQHSLCLPSIRPRVGTTAQPVGRQRVPAWINNRSDSRIGLWSRR